MGKLMAVVVAVGLAGCMPAPAAPRAMTTSPVSAEQAKELAGTWQGWLVTERSFALFNFEIRADGSFEVSGGWTKAEGVLLNADGALRFDGNGLWRGSLVPEQRGGYLTLRLERDDRLVRGYLHRRSNAGGIPPTLPAGEHDGSGAPAMAFAE